MKRIVRPVTLCLAPCLALAACKPAAPPTNDMAANATNASDNAVAASDAGNSVDAPRSILRPDVVEPEVPKVEPVHAVVGFGNVTMTLDDAGRSAIDALLETPAMMAGGPITLRGHSDSRGSDGDNRVASRNRAEAVRDYLVEKGVAADRITLFALGEGRPIAPNVREDGSDDPEGRAKNRRVEIDIAILPVTPPPPVVPTLPDEQKP